MKDTITISNPPIAYGNGRSGGIYHPDCWYACVDEKYASIRARAFLGTVYYKGAENRELKNIKCARCGLGFRAIKRGAK